ncbi:MAG: phage head-tail connector protein [Oscillospiraceae bacterium]
MTSLERMKLKIPEENNNIVLEDYLESAASIIMAKRYPFTDFPLVLEPRYSDLQIRIAVELYNKKGAEGEISHSENGISRTYTSSDVSPELLSEIIPKGKVI